MENKEFNKLLVKYNLLSEQSTKLIEFINTTYPINNNDVLNLISIIFIFNHLGHCYTPLNELRIKYIDILESQEILENELDDESIRTDFETLRDAIESIENSIDDFRLQSNLIGNDKFFIIDSNDVYINKYYYASIGIKESFERLFKGSYPTNASFDNSFINLDLNL